MSHYDLIQFLKVVVHVQLYFYISCVSTSVQFRGITLAFFLRFFLRIIKSSTFTH